MHDWMMDGWGMGLGFVFWVAFLVLIVAAVLWFVRSQKSTSGGAERRAGGLNVLDERYARGEIDREEYLQKKRDLVD
jgi:putative membrane protein